jgi:hypothetical protein
MHPTVQFEIAKTRVVDMRHDAERDRTARVARAARTSGAARNSRAARRGTFAQRLLRLS